MTELDQADHLKWMVESYVKDEVSRVELARRIAFKFIIEDRTRKEYWESVYKILGEEERELKPQLTISGLLKDCGVKLDTYNNKSESE